MSAVFHHEIDAIYNEKSAILILGSFPSVKSRQAQFFYAHPQNRFWRVTSAVFDCATPKTVDEKRSFLLNNNIALWDVISRCEIIGSSDASIKNAVANDIMPLIESSEISRIYTNGQTAHRLYEKYLKKTIGIADICLPSTSPANAKYSLEELIKQWQIIKQ